MAYQTIKTETRGHVGVLTLDRPESMNALNSELMADLAKALAEYNFNDAVGAIVIAGSEKAFAAGADVKEMAESSYPEILLGSQFSDDWEAASRSRKPIIAAVSGHALGGGMELALMCDIILASPTAKFGLPEITLGVIPGIGGTQRLTRIVGKAKAMEMVLSGRSMNAEEAERMGLVSRIIEADSLLDEAISVASKIAEMSAPALYLAKAMVNGAYETSLSEGCKAERLAFLSLFATEDQKEGMTAFLEKRKPQFRNK